MWERTGEFRCPRRPEGIRCPAAEVTGNCQPPNISWVPELNSGPLQERGTLLTITPSVQLQWLWFITVKGHRRRAAMKRATCSSIQASSLYAASSVLPSRVTDSINSPWQWGVNNTHSILPAMEIHQAQGTHRVQLHRYKWLCPRLISTLQTS